MILVDTNVLLDVIEDDSRWADWSQAQLEAASLNDRLAIAFERVEELEQLIFDAAPASQGHEAGRPAGFLHRRAYGGDAVAVADARRGALPGLFPDRATDYSGVMLAQPKTPSDASCWPSVSVLRFLPGSSLLREGVTAIRRTGSMRKPMVLTAASSRRRQGTLARDAYCN